MKEMKVKTVRTADRKPNYQKTAPQLLARCREFFKDPENEKEFQEWKAGKAEMNEQKAI